MLPLSGVLELNSGPLQDTRSFPCSPSFQPKLVKVLQSRTFGNGFSPTGVDLCLFPLEEFAISQQSGSEKLSCDVGLLQCSTERTREVSPTPSENRGNGDVFSRLISDAEEPMPGSE